MTRYAVLAGSNFVGTPNQLAGCINDLINVRKLIEPTGITILADLRDHNMTTQNWKNALKEAVNKAQSGDVIFHMHSHHGAQIKDPNGGLDEIWCPDDFDWSPEKMIVDKWMGQLISTLQPGVKWIDWADCCHSGDSLRDLWCPNEKPRYIVNKDLLNFVHNGKLSPIVVSGNDRKGLLLAACRSNQTSADAYINGQSCGAFSHYMQQAINENRCSTYENLTIRTTQLLTMNGYDQRPEIDCKSGDEKTTFSQDVLNASKLMMKIKKVFKK